MEAGREDTQVISGQTRRIGKPGFARARKNYRAEAQKARRA